MVKSRPGKISYEFGGTPGAVGIMIGLPVLMYLLNFFVIQNPDLNFLTVQNFLRSLPLSSDQLTSTEQLSALGFVTAWLAFLGLLAIFIPAHLVQGQPPVLHGPQLQYRLNGHSTFWITIAIGILFRQKLSLMYTYHVELMTASIFISFVLSLFLYHYSFRPNSYLSPNVMPPVRDFIYELFIGRELNPRFGLFDLKFFCELRPGLLLWLGLNTAAMLKQYELRGFVSMEMLLLNGCQALYVWHALYNEHSMLTMMDITNDGFGWMLAFGDLALVPFTYCLQSRYLVQTDPQLGTVTLGAITVLNLLGYFIFDGANNQKFQFRTSPEKCSEFKWLETSNGKRLLISGYWGLARKMNYTGDFIMGVAWCLYCGFESVLPYFYCLYFFILLLHRARRDDHICFRKYGQDWIRYKERVPYVFVPYVY